MAENDDVTQRPVTAQDFTEAEVDARIHRFTTAGGMNHGLVYDTPTPTDDQPVPRMNRDTLYAGIPIDTIQGYSITLPEHPEDRYVSAYVFDNDHMTLHFLRGSGVTYTFEAQEATRWVVAIIRVQLFDPSNEADVEATREILSRAKVESGSMQEKPLPGRDWQAMLDLRHQYEVQYRDVRQVPAAVWQGYRGDVDRYGGHNSAVASAWGCSLTLKPSTSTSSPDCRPKGASKRPTWSPTTMPSGASPSMTARATCSRTTATSIAQRRRTTRMGP